MNVISELSSTIEPNFLKEIISEYPEYFIWDMMKMEAQYILRKLFLNY
jgi:hypothetical protein